MRFGKRLYAALVQRTMSLTESMSAKPGVGEVLPVRPVAHASCLARGAAENGVIIRLQPFGSSPIVAPRLSSSAPRRRPRAWMWRKWYTSRNASAVTFQLHGTMDDCAWRCSAACSPWNSVDLVDAGAEPLAAAARRRGPG